MGSLPEDTLCAYCGKRTVMRSHLLQLLDDVSDDEINQGHGPALTNAIDHVNGEAPLRALVPNPAQQDADVVFIRGNQEMQLYMIELISQFTDPWIAELPRVPSKVKARFDPWRTWADKKPSSKPPLRWRQAKQEASQHLQRE